MPATWLCSQERERSNPQMRFSATSMGTKTIRAVRNSSSSERISVFRRATPLGMVGILTNLAAGYWLPVTGDVYQRITCQDSESLNIIVGSLRECGKPRRPLGNVGCGLMFLSWPANLWGTARLQSADG